MAKKEKQETKEVAQAETTAVEIVGVEREQTLAERFTAMGVSPSLIRRAEKAQANLALMENPRIPRAQAVTDGLILDQSNPDADSVKEVTGVLFFAAKYKAFYLKEYDPSNPVKAPPDCFSHDGRAPSPDSANPQSRQCKTCANNEFETAKMGKGKACRDMRRLFILQSVKPGAETIMPLQINATPTSIKNFDAYLSSLVQYGYSLDEVETKITAKKKAAADKYVVLNFSRVRAFDEANSEDKQVLTNIKALKEVWLPLMERQHVDAEEIAKEEIASAPESSAAGQKGDY